MKITAEYETNIEAPVHTLLDINLLIKILSSEGITPAAILEYSGITPEDLHDQHKLVSFKQKLAVFSNAVRLSNNPALGLIAGSSAKFSDFGFFGYAVISSETLGKAIELGFKYLRLAGPVLKKTVQVKDSVGVFTGHDVIDLGDLLPFCTEYWFGSINALCSEILGSPFPGLKLRVPYPEPSYSEEYQRIFNCEVEFNADAIEWYFDATALALPVPTANPLTVKMCMQTCEEMLALVSTPANLAEEVSAHILNATGRYPNIEQTAEAFGMSSRNLRRHLADAGTSFQQIRDDTRCRLALKFLETTNMTVEEIAHRIGFTEASNFRHALRKWTGKTPNEFRLGKV